MNEILTTLDGLLNRRVILEQPAAGYRVAVDTVLLAAAVPAAAGDKALDLGCGVGGAMLCLACRVAGMTGVGIDIQHELVELCHRNIARNAFAAGFEAQQEDVAHLPPDLCGAFDHVFMNPPYHEENRHDASPHAMKRAANTEKMGDLALWIGSAAAALKPFGTLTMIHRADRREEILSCLRNSFGEIEILPLLPKQGVEPKRVIFRARKNAAFSVRECPHLTLHEEGGGYTDEAERVLRHCGSLFI
ncbi:MAG: methyltransferase [Alphaproteobacteria bacterium]|nr:methyltransferase [Alphaproteobacteria bacterium]